MDDLREKVCLVTGASTGIGAAVARALGGHGASVAVHYHRSADEAQRVAEDIGGGRPGRSCCRATSAIRRSPAAWSRTRSRRSGAWTS